MALSGATTRVQQGLGFWDQGLACSAAESVPGQCAFSLSWCSGTCTCNVRIGCSVKCVQYNCQPCAVPYGTWRALGLLLAVLFTELAVPLLHARCVLQMFLAATVIVILACSYQLEVVGLCPAGVLCCDWGV